MRTSVLFALAVAFFAAAFVVAPASVQPANGQASGPNVTPAQLAGSWKGAECESAPPSKISRQRRFAFTATTWNIMVQVYGDKSCTADALLFSVDFGGSYELGANSAAVPGAQEARFAFDHKLVTSTLAGMDFLAPRCSQYAWTPDAAQDIGQAGCGDLWGSIPSCPAEYDLVAISDGMLRLGDRGHLLCTPATRPTKLQAAGFRKE
jgi:adenomatous polyposis coli down-regulated (APCDD)-like protein